MVTDPLISKYMKPTGSFNVLEYLVILSFTKSADRDEYGFRNEARTSYFPDLGK